MKTARIAKIAGISFAGFVIAMVAADKVNLGPALSQIAGVVGGLIGGLVDRRNERKSDQARETEAAGEGPRLPAPQLPIPPR